jgi:hypothetical protein
MKRLVVKRLYGPQRLTGRAGEIPSLSWNRTQVVYREDSLFAGNGTVLLHVS